MNFDSAIDKLLTFSPFELNEKKRKELFNQALYEAFCYHIENNKLFRSFCSKRNFSLAHPLEKLSDIPYLPVNIFKNRQLLSVQARDIKATLHSSATTGTSSTIVVDEITSKRQTLASAKVIADYLGSHRRPFLILDEDPSKSKSSKISARSAATRGFLVFASSAEYFLNKIDGHLNLDIERLQDTLKIYEKNNQEICIFGFTYILYNNVIKILNENYVTFHLPKNSKVAHIGGWKKLEDQKVNKEIFLDDIHNILNVEKYNTIDFYGFTEQMGLVYANLGDLPKTVPLYSEIIIRDFKTLKPATDGDVGLIQMLTPLPHSYPGISVLTEDVGRIVGRGKDQTGRWGTQFEVLGRAKKAEARGCGDILSEIIN